MLLPCPRAPYIYYLLKETFYCEIMFTNIVYFLFPVLTLPDSVFTDAWESSLCFYLCFNFLCTPLCHPPDGAATLFVPLVIPVVHYVLRISCWTSCYDSLIQWHTFCITFTNFCCQNYYKVSQEVLIFFYYLVLLNFYLHSKYKYVHFYANIKPKLYFCYFFFHYYIKHYS